MPGYIRKEDLSYATALLQFFACVLKSFAFSSPSSTICTIFMQVILNKRQFWELLSNQETSGGSEQTFHLYQPRDLDGLDAYPLLTYLYTSSPLLKPVCLLLKIIPPPRLPSMQSLPHIFTDVTRLHTQV